MRITKKLKTFYIQTLGCKTNQSESDDIFNVLANKGYRSVELKNRPDFVILNTCTVTSLADKKARQLMGRVRKESPDSLLIVTGCFTFFNSDSLKKEAKADLIISNNEKLKIPELIEKKFLCSPDKKGGKFYRSSFYHCRAFIKVQDGCENNCSYCIVPCVRGGYSSTGSKEIIEKINSYIKKGFTEAVITGIHIGRYGVDFKKKGRKSEKIDNLALLLEYILEETSIRRLRLSSIEVREITRELIEIIKKSDGRIARHLHIPLQSGSDRILKAMKRNYNTGYFIDKVSMVGDLIPEATITTDVIVGFPGETDDDFYLTLDLFDKLKFSKVHVFKYSRRAGTAAAGMQAQVSENIKTIRSLAARKKGEAIREEFLAKNTGKVLEVVCEEFDSTGMTKGLADGISENYIRVYFEMDREEFSSEKGRIIRVKAVQQYMDGLKGFAQML